MQAKWLGVIEKWLEKNKKLHFQITSFLLSTLFPNHSKRSAIEPPHLLSCTLPQQIQITSSTTAKQGKRNACGRVERQTRKKKKGPFYDFLESHAISSSATGDNKFTPAKWKEQKIERQLTIAILELFSIIVLKMMQMGPL